MPEPLDAFTIALLSAIEAGTQAAIVAAARDASESDRRAAAPVVIAAAKQLERGANATFSADVREQLSKGPLGRVTPAPIHAQAGASRLALAAVASVGELRALGINYLPDDDEHSAPVLLGRPRDWLAAWLDLALESRRDWIPTWRLVRRLVVEGELPTPTADGYIVRMTAAGARGKARELLDLDRALLEREVWRLFEVEGTQESSLSSTAKYTGATWDSALADLAAAGRLDRGRLLDATLSALARDWGAYRLSWYTAFWKRLAPTPDERVGRAPALVRLLTSTAPPIVGFAVDELHAVVKGGGEVSDLLGALTPALQSETKKTAQRALAIVDGLAKRAEVTPDAAALAVVSAVNHPKPEVQRAALTRIARWVPAPTSSGPLADALRAAAEGVATTERPALDALLAGGANTEHADARADADPSRAAPPEVSAQPTPTLEELRARIEALPAHVARGLDLVGAVDDDALPLPPAPIPGEPFLDPAESVVPITSPDEFCDTLLTAAAVGLRRTVGAVEHERLLDAIGRWCGDRGLFDGALRPLRDLGTRDRAEEDWGEIDAVDLTIAWRDGGLDDDLRSMRVPSRRLRDALARAAVGVPSPTLALPTHLGGWIDPDVLLDRLVALPTSFAAGDDVELAAALLRVPTAKALGRDDALLRARAIGGEAAELLAAVLAGEPPAANGPGERGGAAVQVVEARARVSDAALRGIALPDRYGVPAATLEGAVREDGDDEAVGPVEALFRRVEQRSSYRRAASVAIAAPPWRVLAQFVDAQALVADDAWGSVDHSSPEGRPLHLLLHASEPLTAQAVHVLTGGLAAQRAEVHLLAVDGVLAAIEHGRLDAALLGQALRDGLGSGRLPANRVAARLASAGEVSDLHFAVLRDALELGIALPSKPTNLAALLELLDQWCARQGTAVREPATRAFLAALSGSSKSARLARTLLARDAPPPAGERRLRLEARVRRGERWARIEAGHAAR